MAIRLLWWNLSNIKWGAVSNYFLPLISSKLLANMKNKNVNFSPKKLQTSPGSPQIMTNTTKKLGKLFSFRILCHQTRFRHYVMGYALTCLSVEFPFPRFWRSACVYQAIYLGGLHAHTHVAPTSKMDVFCFSFSSSVVVVLSQFT